MSTEKEKALEGVSSAFGKKDIGLSGEMTLINDIYSEPIPDIDISKNNSDQEDKKPEEGNEKIPIVTQEELKVENRESKTPPIELKGEYTTQDFFKLLYSKRTMGGVEIRYAYKTGYKPEKGAVDYDGKQNFYMMDELLGMDFTGKKGCCFGIATRKEGQVGGKDKVSQVTCLWSDADVYAMKGTKEEAIKEVYGKMAKAEIPKPSIVIFSGGGFHLYWLLSGPIGIKSKADIDFVEGINRGIAQRIGTDDVSNIDRIFRVPNSINEKWKAQTKILKLEPEYFDIEKFRPLFTTKTQKMGEEEDLGWFERYMTPGFKVSEPGRHLALEKISGHYGNNNTNLSQKDIRLILYNWNGSHCSPPLPKEEVDGITIYGKDIPEVMEPELVIIEPTKKALMGENNYDFPEDVMSGCAGRFASIYSQYLESPIQFWYFAYLTCLGNIISGRVFIKGELDIYARLYTLLLGESADDRKSTAITITTKAFRDYFGDDEFTFSNGVGSAEGLQRRMKDKPRLLLCNDEFRAFLSKCKIENSVLLPCVTTLFENLEYSNAVKKSDVDIRDVHLSMLSASTIPTFQATWVEKFTDIGFTNRLWIVPGKSTKRFHSQKILSARDTDIIKQDFDRLKEYLPQTKGHKRGDEKNETPYGMKMLELTEEADRFHEEWYNTRIRSEYGKRIDTYVKRLMVLFAVNERKGKIDMDIVKNVISLGEWQTRVRGELSPIDADSKIARMEIKIRRAVDNGHNTMREMKQYTNADREGTWPFKTALKNLQDAREIAFDVKRGRYFRIVEK